MLRRIFALGLISTALLAGVSDAQEAKPKEPGTAPAKVVSKTREQAEKEFETQLSNATLAGFATTDGEDADKPLKPDRYTLGMVKKIEGNADLYLFTYSYKGTPLPLPLTVKWAGTTPVITLDELTIPGMGTFSARVMFHGDRYAGTWQHGAKGGLMFGKIERAAEKPAEKPAAKATEKPKAE